VEVVPPVLSAREVDAHASGRKDVLPSQVAGGGGVLGAVGTGHVDPATAPLEVALMELPHTLDVPDDGLDEPFREHGHAVASSFRAPHDDLASLGIHVLDAEPHPFHHAKPGSVEYLGYEGRRPREAREQRAHLLSREHDGACLVRRGLRTLLGSSRARASTSLSRKQRALAACLCVDTLTLPWLAR